MNVKCISCGESFPDAFTGSFHVCPKVAGPRLQTAELARPICTCGHPQGWHWRDYGSCLECLCTGFEQKEVS